MKNLDALKRNLEYFKETGMKPNYSALARIYDCDYRTVKKYFKEDSSQSKKNHSENSKNK